MKAPATPEAYLAALPADRRAVMEKLHAAICSAAPKLGKVKVGRSCITFKKLEDLDPRPRWQS